MVAKNSVITSIVWCHCLDLYYVTSSFICYFCTVSANVINNSETRKLTLQTPTLCSRVRCLFITKMAFCFLRPAPAVLRRCLQDLYTFLRPDFSFSQHYLPRQHFLTSTNSVMCSAQQQLLPVSFRWSCLIQTIQASPQPCYQQGSPVQTSEPCSLYSPSSPVFHPTDSSQFIYSEFRSLVFSAQHDHHVLL